MPADDAHLNGQLETGKGSHIVLLEPILLSFLGDADPRQLEVLTCETSFESDVT